MRVPGEDERTAKRLVFYPWRAELAAKGYYPYRLGIQSMDQMNGGGAHGRMLAAIKKFVDPKNILAPGRYSAFVGSKPLEHSARERALLIRLSKVSEHYAGGRAVELAGVSDDHHASSVIEDFRR